MGDKDSKVVPLNASAITPEVICQLFSEQAGSYQAAIIIGIDKDGDVCIHNSSDPVEAAYLSQALALYSQSLTILSLGPKNNRFDKKTLEQLYNDLGDEE
jgi:hypothetical protein